MIPVDFSGSNAVFGAEQPEYLPLPALLSSDGRATSCWQLDPAEVAEVVRTGRIYLTQNTQGQPLQPVLLHVALVERDT